jgi:hypothetical protein
MARKPVTLRLLELDPHSTALTIAITTKTAIGELRRVLLGDATPDPIEPMDTEVYAAIRVLLRYIHGGALAEGESLESFVHPLLWLWKRPAEALPVDEPSATEDEWGREMERATEELHGTIPGLIVAAALATAKLRDAEAGKRRLEPLTTGEVALLAGLDRSSVTTLAANGEIPGAYRDEVDKRLPWRFKPSASFRKWLHGRMAPERSHGSETAP